MFFVLSEIRPRTGGKGAPPTIAIMIRLDPIFVSWPRPFIPSANMVGNMIDIKKPIPINAYTVIIPLLKMATNESKILMAA